MPPVNESFYWKGKKGFEVRFNLIILFAWEISAL